MGQTLEGRCLAAKVSDVTLWCAEVLKTRLPDFSGKSLQRWRMHSSGRHAGEKTKGRRPWREPTGAELWQWHGARREESRRESLLKWKPWDWVKDSVGGERQEGVQSPSDGSALGN